MKHKNLTVEYPTWEMNSFRDLLDGIESRYADNIAFLWRSPDAEDGAVSHTYADTVTDIKNLAAYLCAMGLEHRRIAVCGRNSFDWAISYLAVGCGCGTVVPLDKELRADELSDLLADAECDAVLYGDDVREKLESVELPGLLKLPMASMPLYLEQGGALRGAGSRTYEHHTADPDAPGVLLYTSGTLGVARGVLLSQHSICADIVGVCRQCRITESDRMLSHLPLHHIYECTAMLAALYSGASIAFNDNLRRMPSDLTLFRPTVLVTVPAVLEFMSRFVRHGYADARGGRLLLGVQRAATGVVAGALGTVSRTAAEKSRRRIFSTVHKFMGGRLRAIFVGAAPLSEEVFRQFEQFGYAVYLGYGLTETSSVALMHSDRYRTPGDVGFPISGVEVRIDAPDDDGIGELCIRGETVMCGYYNNAQATAEVLRDGWLYTGDLAQQTPTGAYRITGRKKSVIVSKTGKKIYPEELELYYMKNPLVSECLVYAEEHDGAQTLCVAVYPDITELVRQLNLPPDTDLSRLTQAEIDRAKTLLLDTVHTVNAAFPSYKHVKKLVVRKTEFSKTAASKIKRSAPENAREDTE